jgi:hypothetical protein
LRRLTLTIGLLIIVAGLYIANQGTQILTPLAGVTGQVSEGVSITPVLSTTLLSIPASNYTYLTVNLRENVKTIGLAQVEGEGQVGLYIMNAGNFTRWRLGNPSAVALAKPDVTSYNFTFIPDGSGLYYFVFSNQDPVHKNVIFSLNSVTYTMTPSPIVQYATYELIIVGALLTVIGVKTGKRAASWKDDATTSASSDSKSAKCKFCGNDLAEGELFCPKCNRSQS